MHTSGSPNRRLPTTWKQGLPMLQMRGGKRQVTEWIRDVLIHTDYPTLGRSGKETIRRYLEQHSGLSKAMVLRHVLSYSARLRVFGDESTAPVAGALTSHSSQKISFGRHTVLVAALLLLTAVAAGKWAQSNTLQGQLLALQSDVLKRERAYVAQVESPSGTVLAAPRSTASPSDAERLENLRRAVFARIERLQRRLGRSAAANGVTGASTLASIFELTGKGQDGQILMLLRGKPMWVNLPGTIAADLDPPSRHRPYDPAGGEPRSYGGGNPTSGGTSTSGGGGSSITLPIGINTDTTGTLSQSRGGLGFTSYSSGDLLLGTAAGGLTKLGVGSQDYVLTSSGGTVLWAPATGGSSGGGGWTDIGPVVRLTSGGDRVGIGTGTPNAKFSVIGSGSFTGTLSGSALNIQGDASYIRGTVAIGKSTINSGPRLEVLGTISGSALNISNMISGSGGLAVRGAVTFRSLTGCTALQTDANGLLSCTTPAGTFGSGNVITIGNQRYVSKQGDTMTGALVIQNGNSSTNTSAALLNVRGTMSGRSLVVSGSGSNPLFHVDSTTGRVTVGVGTGTDLMNIKGGRLSIVRPGVSTYGNQLTYHFSVTNYQQGGTYGELTLGVDTTGNALMQSYSGLPIIMQPSGNNVAISKTTAKSKLDVLGTISGSALTINGSITNTGSLTTRGAITFRSLTGCTALQTDANGVVSCGSGGSGSFGSGNVITIGNQRYVSKQGDTMTGALVINVTGGTRNTLGLRVINTMSGANIHAEQLLTSSGGLVVEGTTFTQRLVVNNATDDSFYKVNISGGLITNKYLYAASTDILATAQGVYLMSRNGFGDSSLSGLFEAGSDAPIATYHYSGAPSQYVQLGDTSQIYLPINGGFVGVGTNNPKAKLDVVGTISGSALKITNMISGSGGLTVRGAIAFRTLTGCTALQTDSNGVLSCGSNAGTFGSGNVITIGNQRYVSKQGDTMTGALTIQNGNTHSATTTALLNVRGTMSGRGLWLTGTGSRPLLMTNVTRGIVGIGTSNPTQPGAALQVESGSVTILRNGITSYGGNTSYHLEISNAGHNGTYGELGLGVDTSGNAILQSFGSRPIIMNPSGNSVIIGAGKTSALATLDVVGSISGSSLTINGSITNTGSLTTRGAITFRSLTGCTALQTDSNGTLSCGTPAGTFGSGNVITIGNSRYVSKQGDTMTGALVIQNGNTHTATSTPLLTVRGTMSGRSLWLSGTGSLPLLSTVTQTNTIVFGTGGLKQTGAGIFPVIATAPRPKIAGSVATGNNPYGIAVADHYAYVVNGGDDALTIYDLTNPTAPVSLGSVGTRDFPFSVTVQGRYAYVTTYTTATSSLQIFDVSNPSAPTLVGFVPTANNPVRVVVAGRYAYVVTEGVERLHVIDVSNPASPEIVASSQLDFEGPSSLAVAGSYVYTSNSVNGAMIVFDVSNPKTPRRVSNTSALSQPQDIVVQGRYAYIASEGTGRLQIFDISNPASPTSVGSLLARGNIQKLAIAGRYVYALIQGSTGMQVFDVSNPASPVDMGVFSTGTAPSGIALSGRYAYIINDSSGTLQVYDLGGAYINAAEIGNVESTSISVADTLNARSITARGSLQVGQGGMQVQGPSAFINSSTGSYALQILSSTGGLRIGARTSAQAHISFGTGTNFDTRLWRAAGLALQTNANFYARSFSGTQLFIRGAMSGSSLYVSNMISGSGGLTVRGTITFRSLTGCTALQTDANGVVSCGSGGSGSFGSGNVITIGNQRYVSKQGDTMTGALVIQNGNTHAATTTPLLNVRGTMSGRSLYISGSGSSPILMTSLARNRVGIGTNSPKATLDVVGAISGSSLFIANLNAAACDVKATNGVLSCGTDVTGGSGSFGSGNVITIGNQRYVSKQGDTMTGALVIAVTGGNQNTLGLRVINTMSGAIVQATKQLRSSGTLITESGAVFDGGTLFVDAAGDRIGMGTLQPLFDVHVVKDSTGIGVRNVTRDTSLTGSAFLEVRNSDNAAATLGVYGPNYVSSPYFTSNGTLSATNGLFIYSDSGVSSGGANTISFMTGGNDPLTQIRMTIDSTGGVGIGKTTISAGQKFEVLGTISGSALKISNLISGSGGMTVRGAIAFRSLTGCAALQTNSNGVLSCGSNAGTFGSGNVITIGNQRYVSKQGDTMTGALVINVTGGTRDTLGMRVINTLSGAQIHAQRLLTSSGGLSVEGGNSFMSGSLTIYPVGGAAGLNIIAAANGALARFGNVGASVGNYVEFSNRSINVYDASDTSNTTLYLGTGGAGVAIGKPLDGVRAGTKLDVLGTISGSALVINGTSTFFGNLMPGVDDAYDIGSNSVRWRHMYLSGGTLNIGTATSSGSIGYRTHGTEGLQFFGKASSATPSLFISSGGLIGMGTTSPRASLEVMGSISGSSIRISSTFSTSGSLTVQGGVTFRSLTGCTALQTNSSGVVSCGSGGTGSFGSGNVITIGNQRYVSKQGDTMTGALVINVTGGTRDTLGLRVINTLSGAHLHAEQLLTSSGGLVVEGQSTFNAQSTWMDANLYTFDTVNNTKMRFIANQGTIPMISAVNGAETVYKNLQIDASHLLINTYSLGNVGIGATVPKTKLEVVGTISGSSLRISSGISSSGGLIAQGAVRFRSLTSCSSLQSDSTGLLSCGSVSSSSFGSGNVITIGNQRYVSKQGDTMTGALVIQNGNTHAATATPLLNVRGTMSGRSLWISGSSNLPLLYTDTTNNRVGLGTTTPSSAFDVTNLASGSDGIHIGSNTASYGEIYLRPNSTVFYPGTAGTSRFEIVSDVNNAIRVLRVDTTTVGGSGSGSLRMNGSVMVNDFQDDGILRVYGNSDSALLATNAATDRVGIGTLTPKTKLEVLGTISGSALRISSGISSSGGLIAQGTVRFRSLTNCTVLQTDANGTLSCGSGSSGMTQSEADGRYVNTSGDTMTGALVIQNGNTHSATTTPLLNVRGTMSGSHLYISGTGSSPLLATTTSNFIGFGTSTPNAFVTIRPLAGTSAVGLNVAATMSGRLLTVWGTGSTPIISTRAGNAAVGIGITTPVEALDVVGNMRSTNFRNYGFTRTLPTTINDEVDIGSFTTTLGGVVFEVDIVSPNSGFSMSKHYTIPVYYSATGGAWHTVIANSSTGPFSANDFDLDISVSNETVQMRIRRTLGSTAGTLYVHIRQYGVKTDSFSPSTATSSVAAPSVYFGSNQLTQVGSLGFVGIGKIAPKALLDVQGMMSGTNLTVSNKIGINYLNPRTALETKGTISGSTIITSFLGLGGNVNPTVPLDVQGEIRTTNFRTQSATRTLPTTVNDAVDIGTWTVNNSGGRTFYIDAVVTTGSFSVAKQFLVSNFYHSSGWVTLLPITNTGPFSGNDFDLDINVSNSSTQMRVRRTAGSTAASVYLTFKEQGINTDSFTPSTSTSTVSAPTAYYGTTLITQNATSGFVGIGKMTPSTKLEVVGTISGSALRISNMITASGGAVIRGTTIVRGMLSGSILSISGNANITGSLLVRNNIFARGNISGTGNLVMDGTVTLRGVSGCTNGIQSDANGALSCASGAGITQSVADGRYVNIGGDTMTGTLVIQNGNTHSNTATALLNVRGTMSGRGLWVSGTGSVPLISVSNGRLGIGTSSPVAMMDVRVPMEQGLIGWFAADEHGGTHTFDKSISSNSGRLINGATWTLGKNGNALFFDGTDDYVTLGANNELSGQQVPVTITGWFKQSSTTGNKILYSAYQSVGSSQLWSMIRLESGLLVYYTSTANGSFQSAGSLSATVNQWHHFAVVVTGTTSSPRVAFYLDDKRQTATLAAMSTTPDLTVPISIGANYAGGEPFAGLIDELRIYNRELNAREVAEHARLTQLTIAGGTTFGELRIDSGAKLNVLGMMSGSLLTVSGNANITGALLVRGNITTRGTFSGAVLYASQTIRSSGSIVLEGMLSGATINGFGLSTDCDGSSNKITWDATTSRFKCEADQTGAGGSFGSGNVITIGNTRYVSKQGGTMTGALIIQSGNSVSNVGTALLNVRGVMSGRTLVLSGSGSRTDALTIRKTGSGLAIALSGSVIRQNAYGAPTLISGATLGGSVGANAIAVDRGYAFIGRSTVTGNEFQVFDIKNPATPKLIGGLDLGVDVNDVKVQGNYVYLSLASAFQNKNFLIVDISIPATPVVIGGYTNSNPILRTSIVGKLAYVASSTSPKFRILDISNPRNISLVSSCTFSKGINDIAVRGTMAYTANVDSAGSTAVNVSNPALPSGCQGGGGISTPPADRIVVSGNYSFRTSADGAGAGLSVIIRRLDTATDTTFNIPIAPSASTSNAIAIMGRFLLIGFSDTATTSSLVVLDISNPISPRQVGTYELAPAGTPITGIAVDGKYAYITSTNTTGLNFRILDLPGIDAPTASIGVLSAISILTHGDVKVGQNLSVGESLQVGRGGIFSQGSLTVIATGTGAGLNALDVRSASGSALFVVTSSGTVAIGTGTSLNVQAKATIFTENSFNQPALAIKSKETTSTQDMFTITTDYNSTSNLVYRITASGATYADAPFNSAGADYAEWFPSNPAEKMVAGDAVCLDPAFDNRVKKCTREGDPNLMGIVSTKPSFVGNAVAGSVLDGLGLPVPGYTLVGLIGQLDSTATTVGSGGVIKPGDSLTSSSLPGVLRRALPGEPTVGVALTGVSGSGGSIRVLIARSNKSMTVDAVEERVRTSVAALKIDDEIRASMEAALSDSAFDERISTAVSSQLSALHPLQDRISTVETQLSALSSLVAALSGSTTRVTSNEQSYSGTLTLTGSLAANALSAEETLAVGRDARIGGDLYLEGALIMTGDMNFSGNIQTGKLTAASGSIIEGTLAVAGDLLLTRNLTFQTGATLTAKQLLLSGALIVRGPITIEGLATFLGNVDVKGELKVTTRQAGYALVKAGESKVVVTFDPPFTAVPVVTVTPQGRVGREWWSDRATMTGFTIYTDTPVTADVTFSYNALTTDAPHTASGSFASAPAGTIFFPIDAQGVPLSTSAIWNACIRHEQPLDPATGQPFSCSRYTPDLYIWNHPDFPGMTFVWNDSYTPPLLILPEGFVTQIISTNSSFSSDSSSSDSSSSDSSSSDSSSSDDSSSSLSSSSESSSDSSSSDSSSSDSSSSDSSSSDSSSSDSSSSDSSSSDSSSSDSSSSEGSSSSQ